MLLALCCLAAVVVATPIDHARLQLRSLSNGLESSNCAKYHGKAGSNGIFYLPPGCASDGEGLTARFAGWERGRVYWESDSAVESDLMMRGVDSRAFETLAVAGRSQMVLNGVGTDGGAVSREIGKVVILATEEGRLVQLENDAALLQMTSSPSHRFTELVHISPLPLPLPYSTSLAESTHSTVSDSARQRIINQLSQLRFSPSISNILAKLPVEQLKSDIRQLSGEDQSSNATWNTRHSMSRGGMQASQWLLEQFEEMGMQNCSREFYLSNFSPNVVCYLGGIDVNSSTLLISAHYDGRGTWGENSAPAANDDGTGTALILSIARHISSLKLRFYHNVAIVLFSGEEQGLLGSQHFAAKLKEEKVDIKLALQTDMIGYRKPGEPLQMALPDLIGLTEARYLVGNISTLYAPELVVGTTPACCSDHQSFDAIGYPATWVFERNGPIADPMYHNSGDLSDREGFDFEQVHAITTVVLATLLETAEFQFSI